MANVKLRPHYQTIDGIRFPSSFSPVCIRETLSYTTKPDDVFVVSYPKSGSTWMQNVALHIFRKGKEMENISEFRRLCPIIDAFGQQSIVNMPRPGAYKTHLPYSHVPYSPEAKYVYVLRNPKDCYVSLYYHTKSVHENGYWDGEFDDFFELFITGEVMYNDYFDHLMSWEKNWNSKQVFFTTYEDMKRDPKSVVLQLASLLGREYIEAIEKDNAVLNNIIRFTGLEYMKKQFRHFIDSSTYASILEDPNAFEGMKYRIRYSQSLNFPEEKQFQFVRKGVIGDWKEHLSEEQSERLNKKFLERTKGTEIYDMYKEFM